jgi:hypothetical protein
VETIFAASPRARIGTQQQTELGVVECSHGGVQNHESTQQNAQLLGIAFLSA